MAFVAGERLGPYEIMSPIGSGGMGEVWKARDTRLDRFVAIKRLRGQPDARFEQEARAIAALNHPNICQIHDVGPDYLVLEYINGKPLCGPIPVEEAVRLALQMSGALAEAHRKGIIHRDLKPANILVTETGSAKLLDFGLARLALDANSDSTRTLEGTVMGTAAYMSPEQASGRALDERSDIFSFGAVLYEMLSGRRAFPGASTAEVLSAVLRDEPETLTAPPALTEIVKGCLQKARAERFQTATEVRSALEAISGKTVEQQPSIAVLPFANMSQDPEDEYFSDGLAEEILNLLTHIPGLKVTARTSSFAFRGKQQDIRKIARALGVRTVMEGSVRRAGSRIRVKAQLINAADGYHLWSERYDRELTNVFAVQDEIAEAVAGALQVELVGKSAGTARPHKPHLAAYEAFLKGRHQFAKYSPDGFARAKEYFSEAVALDPDWADPHSALSIVHFLLGGLGLCPLVAMVPLARVEARKALELLPSQPTAHAVLGAIAAVYDYDWREAEGHFRLARASESPPPEVRAAYSQYYLLPLGLFEEALDERAKAIVQDPLNVGSRTAHAGTMLCAGMYAQAVAEARAALELDEKYHPAHLVLAETYFFLGDLAKAREPAEEAFRIAPWHPLTVGLLAGLLVLAGEKDRAEKLVATMREMVPSARIMYHLVCSETDQVMDWYERNIELRQPSAAMLASARFLEPLRAHPRWPRLAKMMNLPVLSIYCKQ